MCDTVEKRDQELLWLLGEYGEVFIQTYNINSETDFSVNFQKHLYTYIYFFTFICSCSTSISLKCNQKDATFSRSIYFYKLLYMFQAVPLPIIRSTKLYIQRRVVSNQYCCLLLSWMRWNSMIAAGSSIGSALPDAVCTVLCSWWWVEKLPGTCRAIYRNK
jgi:hypothetical protein